MELMKSPIKPIRCKAAVCRGPDEPLTIEEIVVEPPREHEVRIRVVCSSLCHTDVTCWRSNVSAAFPRILGHEAYGVVESVGPLVEGLAAGDAVVPTFMAQCGACAACASPGTNLCAGVPFTMGPGMRRGGGGTRFFAGGSRGVGEPLHDFLAVSGFSQYTVVDASQVVALDPAVPPRLACLLGCGAGTGVGAAWRLAQVEPGSTVAVFGLGAVGLSVVQGAKMCGASRIIGVDLNPDKEEVAKSFGVTDFINPSQLDKGSVSEAIIAMTGGGADYSFECVGRSAVMAEAVRSGRQGQSKTVILGVEQDGEPIQLPSFEFLFGRCVLGSLFGGIKPKTDIPILARKCMDGELQLERLATHEVALADINRAVDLLVQGKSLRCVIWMDR